MCITVFLWKAHPLYPFILLLNRDEYHSRPTKPLTWWDGDKILGGRDELGKGTWLGSNKDGKVAFVTNVRELHLVHQVKSRGDLPVRFLEGVRSPREYAEEIAKEANLYNGFNLVIADVLSGSMVYITNRPKEENILISEVSPGIHVLSNAKLDTPWPKAERLRHGFQDLFDSFSDCEVPVNLLVESLMQNTVKDDVSLILEIYPSEMEYQLSSIFVDGKNPEIKPLKITRSIEEINDKALEHCSKRLSSVFEGPSTIKFFFSLDRDVMGRGALLRYVSKHVEK